MTTSTALAGSACNARSSDRRAADRASMRALDLGAGKARASTPRCSRATTPPRTRPWPRPSPSAPPIVGPDGRPRHDVCTWYAPRVRLAPQGSSQRPLRSSCTLRRPITAPSPLPSPRPHPPAALRGTRPYATHAHQVPLRLRAGRRAASKRAVESRGFDRRGIE